jgi:hypothetical protein
VTKQDFLQLVDVGFAQQRNVFILRLEREIVILIVDYV